VQIQHFLDYIVWNFCSDSLHIYYFMPVTARGSCNCASPCSFSGSWYDVNMPCHKSGRMRDWVALPSSCGLWSFIVNATCTASLNYLVNRSGSLSITVAPETNLSCDFPELHGRWVRICRVLLAGCALTSLTSSGHFTIGLVFRWYFCWVLNSDWDQSLISQKVKSFFFRLDSAISWAFRWDQTSGRAIAEFKAN